MNPTVETVVTNAAGRMSVRRQIHCPDCRRYLGASVLPAELPAGTFWTRLSCRTCGRWDWFDAATGERRDGRDFVSLTERPSS
jgi:hypothetical protein